LTRYCDDLVIVCPTKAAAEAALTTLGRLLADLGLRLAEAKTRLVETDAGEGFEFLGFHHREVRSFRNPNVMFLARWPGHAAMLRARGRIREILSRRNLLRPVPDVITDVNRFLRGWGAYFRHGNSTRHFNRLDQYVTRGGKVNDVGEPDEGEPHVRNRRGDAGNGARWHGCRDERRTGNRPDCARFAYPAGSPRQRPTRQVQAGLAGLVQTAAQLGSTIGLPRLQLQMGL
jgi:hypothetical protein